MSACLLRISQVRPPRLHADLQPLLLSRGPWARAKMPCLRLRTGAARGGKGPCMQQTRLALECGWHPLTPSPLFPLFSPRQIELSRPHDSCLLPASETSRLTRAIWEFLCPLLQGQTSVLTPHSPLQMGPPLSLTESRSS